MLPIGAGGIFREYEDGTGYLEVLQGVCLTERIPIDFYTDKRIIFRISGS